MISEENTRNPVFNQNAGSNRRKRVRWSRYMIILLSMVLLYLAFRKVDIRGMLTIARGVNIQYLVYGGLIGSLSYFLRGLRWRVLLSKEKSIPSFRVFSANMSGYLGNAVLPARAGELIRAYLISSQESISYSFVLATAATERILDVVALLIICTITIRSLDGVPADLITAIKTMGLIGVAAFVVLLTIPSIKGWIFRLFDRLRIPLDLKTKLAGILEKVLQGVNSFRNPIPGGTFLFYTIVIWLLDALATMVAVKALGLGLSLNQALFFLAALGFSSAVPSTPGYVGVYQFVAVAVLPHFGFTKEHALTYILLSQLVGFLVVAVWGFAGLSQFRARRLPKGNLYDD